MKCQTNMLRAIELPNDAECNTAVLVTAAAAVVVAVDDDDDDDESDNVGNGTKTD